MSDWQESDIPGLAEFPVRPNLRKRRLRDVVETAYHEAGHAVAYEAAGVGLSFIGVTGKVAAQGRVVGQTEGDGADLLDLTVDGDASLRLTDRQHFIIDMAGDAVSRVRDPDASLWNGGVTGEGVLEAAEAGFHVPELKAEAEALVRDRWDRVEAIATALLRSPDLALFPHRDSIIDTLRQAARRAEIAQFFGYTELGKKAPKPEAKPEP
jgi:hypothetical protein